MKYSMLSCVMAGLLVGAVALPAVAQEEGDPARGTVKIEDEELGEPDEPNEVKVGCDFRLDFFGFEEQSVPVRLSLQPPSGEESLEERTAELQAAEGDELSGSLDVDLTDELSQVAPADAEDFDYKVRVDVVVKESEGSEVTKSSILFIDCEAAVLAYQERVAEEDEGADEDAEADQDAEADEDVAADEDEAADEDVAADEDEAADVDQPTQVPAGSGGLASATPPWVVLSMALGILLLAAPVLVTARRRAGRD